MKHNYLLENVDPSGISEYEKLRLKNIEERKRNLESLGISVEGISAPKKNKVSSSKPLLLSTLKKTPVRFSSRLRGLPSSVNIMEPKEENDALPRKKLSMEYLLSLDYEAEELQSKKSYAAESLKPFASTKVIKSLPSQMNLSKISLKEAGVQKVIESGITSLAFHDSLDDILLSVGDKQGNVSLCKLNNREEVHSFKFHEQSVSCMSFDAFNPSKLVTTSYDGTVRQFDFGHLCSDLLYKSEASFTAFHNQIDAHLYLVTLGKGGNVGVLDTREKSKTKLSSTINVFPNGSYAKTISYQDNHFVCGNSYSECVIYDLRNYKKPFLNLLGHTGSINSAFYKQSYGLSTREVLTTDYNNRIRLYSYTHGNSFNNKYPTWSIENSHHNRQGTLFKAFWHPRKELFFVGSLEKEVNAYNSKGNLVQVLSGPRMSSIAYVVVPHPYANIVVGGNSCGKIFIFEE